jgi:uncharacterized SAM-binding protein YcdF (DUF218 family)
MTLNDRNWIGDAPDVAGGRAPLALRVVKITLRTVMMLLLAYVAGFLYFAHHVAAMRQPERIEPADAIIVFTGGHLRLEPAMQLLRTGAGRRLLISGVHPAADALALQRATGAEAPLFECCIDIDRAALDTAGNATETAKWLKVHGFATAILVTSNYHVPRSLVELRHRVRDTRLSVFPVVTSRIDGWRWLTDREVLRVLITEYSKLIAALGRNLIAG